VGLWACERGRRKLLIFGELRGDPQFHSQKHVIFCRMAVSGKSLGKSGLAAGNAGFDSNDFVHEDAIWRRSVGLIALAFYFNCAPAEGNFTQGGAEIRAIA
jgi:hypothetical protein